MDLKHNYHTHTSRCNHADGADAEYAAAAFEAGLKTLGFSDHAPQIGFPDGTYSWYRMKPEETAEYVSSVRRLADEYKGKMNIYCGFELEYYPEMFDATIDFLRPYAPDYVILGQHFIHNEHDGIYSADNLTCEQFLIYCDQVCTAIKTGRYTYLAHPDLVFPPDDREKYLFGMEKICKAAKEEDIPLEYNLLGLAGKRAYPTKRFFELAAEHGNKVILGLDAHTPTAFAWDEHVNTAINTLKSLGITPIGEAELRNPIK